MGYVCVSLSAPPLQLASSSRNATRQQLNECDSSAAGKTAPAGETAADLKELASLHASLQMVAHATEHLAAISVAPPSHASDLPLSAHAKYLGGLYAVKTRQQNMSRSEKTAWASYDTYCMLQLEADAARARRAVRNRELKQARLVATAWERILRSVYNYTFEYTASVKRTVNAATERVWTPEERTAEAQRLYATAAHAHPPSQRTATPPPPLPHTPRCPPAPSGGQVFSTAALHRTPPAHRIAGASAAREAPACSL